MRNYVIKIGSSGVCEEHNVEREVNVRLGVPYNIGIWECPKCIDKGLKISIREQNLKEKVK